MPKKSMSINELCEWYGVKIERVDRAPFGAGGPKGHGCDPERRILYIEPTHRSIEVLLHEFCHIIVQPPWCDIDMMEEDFVLMQFERSLARYAFTDEAVQAVIEWQLDTASGPKNMYLSDYPKYWEKYFWRQGFRNAKKLGLLNKKGVPTGHFPNWLAIPSTANQMKKYVRGHEEQSLF